MDFLTFSSRDEAFFFRASRWKLHRKTDEMECCNFIALFSYQLFKKWRKKWM